MTEYFTSVDQIPRRTNVKLFADIIQRFLNSNLKIAKLDPKLFRDKSHNYRANALQRYVRVHNIRVRIYCINDEIYLEKI
jgi:predicted transposase YbfD/YdcC